MSIKTKADGQNVAVGVATFDFIERVRAVREPIELQRVLKDVTRRFGFEGHSLAELAPRNGPFNAALFYCAFPVEWQERYIERGYFEHDPVVLSAQRSMFPVRWLDVVPGQRHALALQVMREAAEFGLEDGIAIPIWGPRGLAGLASFGGARLDLSQDERRALHILALVAFERARDLAQGETSRPITPHVLSAREIECLQWSAAGKTAWEIGEILRLSERTIESYMKSATAKLDARTRTQAVATAVRRGLIT